MENYLETVTNLIMTVSYWWLWWVVDHFLVFITVIFSTIISNTIISSFSTGECMFPSNQLVSGEKKESLVMRKKYLVNEKKLPQLKERSIFTEPAQSWSTLGNYL